MGILGNLFGGREAKVQKIANDLTGFIAGAFENSGISRKRLLYEDNYEGKREIIGLYFGMIMSVGGRHQLSAEEIYTVARHVFREVFVPAPQDLSDWMEIASEFLSTPEGRTYLAEGMELMDRVLERNS